MAAAWAEHGCGACAGGASGVPALRGARRRDLDDPAPHLPGAHGQPAVEHGQAHRRGDGAVRRDRHGGRLVCRAHRPSRPSDMGGVGGRAAGHTRLRGELWMGLAQHPGRGLSRGGAGDDAGGIPARLPAGRRKLSQLRSRPGGAGAQPWSRTAANLLAGDARTGPGGDPRRLPAGGARAAGRVRRL